MEKLIILIPVCDQADHLPDFFREWKPYHKLIEQRFQLQVEFLLVDDGNRPVDQGILNRISRSEASVRIIRHLDRRGEGQALKTGIYHVIRKKPECRYLCTMEGDGSESPRFVLQLLERVLKPDHPHVVIASRNLDGFGTTEKVPKKITLLHAEKLFFSSLWHIKGVRDYTSGFRLYRMDLLRSAAQVYRNSLITECSHAAVPELLFNLHVLGAKCAEIPFTVQTKKCGYKKPLRLFRDLVQGYTCGVSCQHRLNWVHTNSGVNGHEA